MKAALYYTNDDVRIVDVPVPEIGPGEVLVEMRACGICGSDVMEWYRKPKAPLYFGHELTGIVRQAGEKVTDFKEGDRVFVHHHVPCFTCHYCQRGSYTMCPTYHETNLDPGGFAEFVRVPSFNVQRGMLKLSSEISFDEGTLIEPISCALRGLTKARLRPADTLLILGGGVSGLIHIQVGKLMGAGTVIVSDFIDYKLDKARQFGVDYVINPKNENLKKRIHSINQGRLADIVVVTPGSSSVIEQAVHLVDKGGTLYIFGPPPPGDTLCIDGNHLFFSEINIVSSYSSYISETTAALEYIRRGQVDAAGLITHRFPLSNIGDAMRLAVEAKNSLKILVTP